MLKMVADGKCCEVHVSIEKSSPQRPRRAVLAKLQCGGKRSVWLSFLIRVSLVYLQRSDLHDRPSAPPQRKSPPPGKLEFDK